MTTTRHSIERAKERIGMNPKTAEHFMRNALERGRDKTMFTCEQKRQWLISREKAEGTRALVYNDTCVIVSGDGAVITLFAVPGWFRNSSRYSGKERIRNRAKFEKYNRCSMETSWVM